MNKDTGLKRKFPYDFNKINNNKKTKPNQNGSAKDKYNFLTKIIQNKIKHPRNKTRNQTHSNTSKKTQFSSLQYTK